MHRMEEAMSGLWTMENWEVMVVAAMAAVLAFRFFVGGSKKKKYRLPPGPPTWPLVGSLPALMDPENSKIQPHEIFLRLAKIYGPIMTIKVGSVNTIYVTDLSIIDECLRINDQMLANRPSLNFHRYLIDSTCTMSLSNYGGAWRFIRKLYNQEFFNGNMMGQFDALLTEELTLTARELFEASKLKKAINMQDTFDKLTMNVISRLAWDKKIFDSTTTREGILAGKTKAELEPSRLRLLHCLKTPVKLIRSFLFEDFFPYLAWLDNFTGVRRAMQQTWTEIDLVLSEILEDHMKQFEARALRGDDKTYQCRDFLDVMLMIRATGDDTEHLDYSSMKSILLEVVIAGTETTPTQAEWVLAYLLENPEIMRKAQSEVDSVVGKDRCVTSSDVQRMPYIHAIVKESLRLRAGPHLVPRANLVDCKIAGYDIPANSLLNFQFYSIHTDPELWEDPLQFKPERFLHDGLENFSAKQNMYIPFGAGRRSCPGSTLATRSLQTSIARLIHSFDWSLPMDESSQPVKLDMSMITKFGFIKRIPLEVFPTPRLPAHLY